MGRVLPDGFVIHLGRKDLMVKIRGFRVEFNEVERALLAYPQIQEAAVAAWEKDPGEMFLAAYIVTRNRAPIDVDELRGDLAVRIPDYMIPPVFVFMDSLPFFNGKIDRKALPKATLARPQGLQVYFAPTTALEQELAKIWEEILSCHPIGIHDKFLDLGGNSLTAGRIASRIMRHFQIELPLHELFEAHTVAVLASVVEKHLERRGSDPNLEQLVQSMESMSEEEAERAMAPNSTRK
jgi:acyl carrier protein